MCLYILRLKWRTVNDGKEIKYEWKIYENDRYLWPIECNFFLLSVLIIFTFTYVLWLTFYNVKLCTNYFEIDLN